MILGGTPSSLLGGLDASCLRRRRKHAFELAHIAPQQAARYESDVWEESITTYLGEHPRVTVGELAKEALGIHTGKVGTADQRRISAALERLGWQRERVDWQGKRWWSKP